MDEQPNQPEGFCVGRYTRQGTNDEYQYDGSYKAVGTTVYWNAVVQRGMKLKGRPDGKMIDNNLAGEYLREAVRSVIEINIEKLLKIEK
jgi:hypothetical protein